MTLGVLTVTVVCTLFRHVYWLLSLVTIVLHKLKDATCRAPATNASMPLLPVIKDGSAQ